MSPSQQRRSDRATDAVDPPVGAALRFAVELIAWVSGPLALAEHQRVAGVVLFVVLAGLPTVFNVPGDKQQRPPVAVDGRTRIALELLLCAAAIIGTAAWGRWWLTALAVVVVATAVVAQRPRWLWLRPRPATA